MLSHNPEFELGLTQCQKLVHKMRIFQAFISSTLVISIVDARPQNKVLAIQFQCIIEGHAHYERSHLALPITKKMELKREREWGHGHCNFPLVLTRFRNTTKILTPRFLMTVVIKSVSSITTPPIPALLICIEQIFLMKYANIKMRGHEIPFKAIKKIYHNSITRYERNLSY